MHLHLTLAGDARRSTKDPGAMFCMAKVRHSGAWDGVGLHCDAVSVVLALAYRDACSSL